MPIVTNYPDHIKTHVKDTTRPQHNPAKIASCEDLVSNWLNRQTIQKTTPLPCTRIPACVKPKCAGFAPTAGVAGSAGSVGSATSTADSSVLT